MSDDQSRVDPRSRHSPCLSSTKSKRLKLPSDRQSPSQTQSQKDHFREKLLALSLLAEPLPDEQLGENLCIEVSTSSNCQETKVSSKGVTRRCRLTYLNGGNPAFYTTLCALDIHDARCASAAEKCKDILVGSCLSQLGDLLPGRNVMGTDQGVPGSLAANGHSHCRCAGHRFHFCPERSCSVCKKGRVSNTDDACVLR